MAANRERTFIAIKPDGVQRGLVGKIIKRFEQRGKNAYFFLINRQNMFNVDLKSNLQFRSFALKHQT